MSPALADVLRAGSGGVVPPAHGSLAEQLRRGAGAAAEAAPVCPNAWLLDLFLLINRAFDEERRRGYTINAYQPPESTARLDAAVRKAVQEYVVNGHQDWRQLACFNAEHYVRHLVEENENFEMILICWGKGQRSRVHNHANSHCWLNVLSGGVEELRFASNGTPVHSEPAVAPRLPGVIASTSPCPLLLHAGANKVGRGETAYMCDRLGLHAVRCDDDAIPEGEEGCVSLHIYAPPIRRVRLYEPHEDRVTTRAPGFATIRGVDEEHWQLASHMSSSL